MLSILLSLGGPTVPIRQSLTMRSLESCLRILPFLIVNISQISRRCPKLSFASNLAGYIGTGRTFFSCTDPHIGHAVSPYSLAGPAVLISCMLASPKLVRTQAVQERHAICARHPLILRLPLLSCECRGAEYTVHSKRGAKCVWLVDGVEKSGMKILSRALRLQQALKRKGV